MTYPSSGLYRFSLSYLSSFLSKGMQPFKAVLQAVAPQVGALHIWHQPRSTPEPGFTIKMPL